MAKVEAVPATASTSETVIAKGSELRLRPAASVTRTAMSAKRPIAVGVPEMAPPVDRLRPGGRVPAASAKL
ncbi:hypothetical protein BHAOGJBA_6376 [Methylobacterium hispanicum]|uniref:Uncharacterized protein n=1 Tax=Methylobacterium hispanicum TaxID=270350 RepID=A0AAV4ZY13_9HYPH|nr:hypothetical protein BHAOGJBA_6376 [Methylobacterium hispanicum]